MRNYSAERQQWPSLRFDPVKGNWDNMKLILTIEPKAAAEWSLVNLDCLVTTMCR